MYYDPKECGKRIKELRNLHQLTQNQLSERLNISLSMMSKLEQGTKSISVDLAIEAAEYFHVSLDYLLLGKGMRTDELQKKLLQAEALIRDVATLI
ncbi:hypothetical protein CIAN88_20940 [[Clostridium] innocuum]|uniref:HTH cro/C1-type domain-containing protein n=1 Tax=Clostridium innocuum TaxID=1522 RepID=A0A099I1L3_CLOIN|nr:helix-turn-helix transcriptional regulator [[Clostridium] innocuum]KGJ51431.1 hypothetical protein CIAN88_20940 [[Clostridium] innocuum]